MNIKLPGDKTEAACETCQRFTEATWRYGTFRLKDETDVKDVMQAYCDTCGESLLVAQQSVYKIKEAREREQKVRTSVNLTAPLKDFTFSLVCLKGTDPERGPELILKVFLTDLLRDPGRISEVIKELRSVDKRLLQGRKDQKVDVSFPSDMYSTLDTLAQKTGLRRSEVMRRALWASYKRPQLESDIQKIVDSRRTSVV
jgi:hypothetical protein